MLEFREEKKLISSAAALRLCLSLANEDVETDDDDAVNQVDGFCAALEFSVSSADSQLATANGVFYFYHG